MTPTMIVLAFLAGFSLRHGLAYLFEARAQRIPIRRK